MVDVKIYKAFPTTICQFEYHPSTEEYKNMATGFPESEQFYSYRNTSHGPHQTIDDLHQLPAFTKLTEKVYEVSKHYVDKLHYEYENLEITSMWGNKLDEGGCHPPHNHSNNFLSGVYYLKASSDTSPIQFFDPRAQANVMRPRNKPNWDNASMIQFDAIQGIGYVFPSWLTHWVPPSKDERISISWNIILRGNYGEPNTLQNAHI